MKITSLKDFLEQRCCKSIFRRYVLYGQTTIVRGYYGLFLQHRHSYVMSTMKRDPILNTSQLIIPHRVKRIIDPYYQEQIQQKSGSPTNGSTFIYADELR